SAERSSAGIAARRCAAGEKELAGGPGLQRDGASATLAGGTRANGLRRAARATLGCCAVAGWAEAEQAGWSAGELGRSARRGRGWVGLGSGRTGPSAGFGV